MKEIKEIFQKIEKDKAELKLKIQNIFTKIRNALNEREEELLLEIDNIYNNKYLNDDIINISSSIFILNNININS